jgi:hypothetical protein
MRIVDPPESQLMSINIFQQIESSHIAEEDVAVEVSLSTSL